MNGWNSIVSFFTTTVPQWIQNVIDWFKQLPYNIGVFIGEILGHIANLGVKLVEFVTNDIPNFINKVIDWFKQLPRKNLGVAM